MMLATIALAIACLCGCASADAEPAASADETLARQYLAAYQDFDWAAVEPLLAEDMIFLDATSQDLEAPGAPFDWAGRDAVLAGVRALAPDFGLSRLHYDTDRVFESGGSTVFVGTLQAIYPDGDGGEIWYGAPVVTVVRVSDGRVVEHRDFIDYAGFAVAEPVAHPAP